MKITRLTEHQSLELRLEASNALNHPNWAVGEQLIICPQFGRVDGGGQRLVQVGLRYVGPSPS